MPKYCLNTLIGILFTLSSASASAHSFNLGLVIPLSGPEFQSAQQALDGFLLATTEEDSHPDETSDGHLGGLDSHVLKVDSGVDSTTMLHSLKNLLQKREPIFVTGLLTTETAQLISKLIEQENTVLFDPVKSSMWQNRHGSLKSMNGGSFSASFQNRYGYPPTAEAMRGYVAARLIAATVRSLPEEDLYDREKLVNAFTLVEGNLR